MAPIGARKVAALLLTLDAEAAARLLPHIDEDILAVLGNAMADFEQRGHTPDEAEEVLASFRRILTERGWEVGTPFEELLQKGLGPDGTARILERMRTERIAQQPFGALEKLPTEDLVRTLLGEHPQIVAFVLANLAPTRGAEVLDAFDEEMRSDVLLRVARLDAAPLPNVNAVIETLNRRSAAASGRFRIEGKNRLKTISNIINFMGKSGGQDVMDRMSAVDPQTVESIREIMFTFEDLAKLDGRALQKILSTVDVKQLATALKGVSDDIQEQILGNVSRRVRDSVIDEKGFLGPLPISEVNEARGEITKIARTMIEAGEITLPSAGGDQLVD